MKRETSKKLDKWFMLSWKKLWFIVISGFISVVIHNFGSALLTYLLGYEFEEPVFFIYVVIVLPIYFFVSLIYSLFKIIKKDKKISFELVLSVIFGLIGGVLINKSLEGPWFFGLFSLLFAGISYILIKFFKEEYGKA